MRRHVPKILLTGVTGQVGGELLIALQNIGEVVPAIAPGESFPYGKALVMDLADPGAMRRTVRELKPDLIVNPAAYTAVDKAETESALALKINGEAPGVLAELARELQAGFIHYSTDYVYPGQGDAPYHEDSPTAPLNEYGRSKLAGDQAVQAVGGAYLIFRTSWVYGIVGHNFVKTMLRLGKDRATLKVVGDQFGAPTFARTLADATAMILAQSLPDLNGRLAAQRGVYHLVCGGETSWWGFAQQIFATARQHGYQGSVQEVLSIATREYPTPAARPLNSRLSCRKLEECFRLRPCSWEAALAWAMPGILRYL